MLTEAEEPEIFNGSTFVFQGLPHLKKPEADDEPGLIVIERCDIWGNFFSASYVCRIAKISRATLWRCITRGVIPKPRYRNGRGWPLFSWNQLECVIFGFRKVRSRKLRRSKLKEWIAEHWKD